MSYRARVEGGFANLFVKVHSNTMSARLRHKAGIGLIPIEICIVFYKDLTCLRNDPDLASESALTPRYE